jgi:DNA-directed RNA polymerase sigma subunit (sigma70/sigma32)
LGRWPAEAEVADALGLSRRERERARAALRAGAAREQGEDGAVEALPDHRTAGPEAALATAEEAGRALAVLEKMGPRRAAVLRLRFGLGGGRPQTLQEVGAVLGITRECARQLEGRALAELAEAVGAR